MLIWLIRKKCYLRVSQIRFYQVNRIYNIKALFTTSEIVLIIITLMSVKFI